MCLDLAMLDSTCGTGIDIPHVGVYNRQSLSGVGFAGSHVGGLAKVFVMAAAWLQ